MLEELKTMHSKARGFAEGSGTPSLGTSLSRRRSSNADKRSLSGVRVVLAISPAFSYSH